MIIGDFFRKVWDGAAYVAHHLNPFNSVVRQPNAQERDRLLESVTTRSGLHLTPSPAKSHQVSARKSLSDSAHKTTKSVSSSPVKGVVAPMKQAQPSSATEAQTTKSAGKKRGRGASSSPSRTVKTQKVTGSTVASRTRSRSRPPSTEPEMSPAPLLGKKKHKKNSSAKVKAGNAKKLMRPHSGAGTPSTKITKKKVSSSVKTSSTKKSGKSYQRLL